MDNAFQQVHNVMDILNAWMEVTKLIVIALRAKSDVQMDNAFQQFGFVMVICFAMKVLTLIATVVQTNLNVQMDNAFQKVGYVMDIMIALMVVMKLIAIVLQSNMNA